MKKLVVLVMAISLFGCEVYAQGVTREVWVGKTLANPGDLITNPNILGIPTTIETLTTGKFSSVNVQGPFVARYTAQLNIPVTGDYPFSFTASGESAVWINTTTNFSNLTAGMGFLGSVTLSTPVTITQWTKYAGQKSAKIRLVKGGGYYLQAIQVEKDADKVNHLAVGWQLATGLFERPIPSSRLTAVVPDYTVPTMAITSVASGQVVSNRTTVAISVADVTKVAAVQFQVDGVNQGPEIVAAPYFFDLDTTKLVNGSHVVTFIARGTNGSLTTGSVTVFVANAVSNYEPPPGGMPVNPKAIDFIPSPEHNVLINGVPSVTFYQMGFYALGASSPVIAWSFGKPNIQTDGRIRYDFSNQPYLYMMPLGVYEIRVTAVSFDGKKGLSDPTVPLQIVR